nr:mitochondrial zinc maintenance protein 1, mitochondrial [Quercus suber]
MPGPLLSVAEMTHNKFLATSTYRSLLRAIRIAFNPSPQLRDEKTYTSALQTARAEFRSKRSLASGSVEASESLLHAQSVAQILRENVVQGKHAGKQNEERYKLNIHKDTQRLDNHTAGELKGTTKSFKEIKSATF